MMKKLTNFLDLASQVGPKKGARVAFNYFPWLYHQRLSNSETTVCNVHGHEMEVYLDDDKVSKRLATFGGREAAQTILVKKSISPGDVVVDIGANIGYYTLIEANQVGADGTVYAIEPSPENITLLRENVRRNGYEDRVSITEGAVCGRDGLIDFHMSDENNLHTILDPDSNQVIGRRDDISSDGTNVEGHALDSFLADRSQPDLIRMDIEGGEASAIDGMMETLKHHQPSLLFETHSPFYVDEESDVRPRIEKIFSVGYEPKFIVSAGEVRPAAFAERGYEPTRVVNDYPYRRGIYTGISDNDAVELVCEVPKATRAILLERC